MEPFLGNRVLDGTLRTMDIANGCGVQCDCCFIDAVRPSTIFSYESMNLLFSNQEFLKMLQPTVFRLGSAGDISDHPQAVEIAYMILDKTKPLDARRMSSQGKHHEVKIFTNYRKRTEDKLVKLIELAGGADNRLNISISLPNNRIDTVNRQFKEFAHNHKQLLQWEPYKTHGVDDYLMTFVYDHPELLSGKIIEELRHEFIAYVVKATQSEEASGHSVPHVTIERGIKNILDLLPEYVKGSGGEKNYLTRLGHQVRRIRDRIELRPGYINNPNVNINDVRTSNSVYTTGRVLPNSELINRSQLAERNEAEHMFRARDFASRGLCKTFLNPDAHWMQVYATPVESYTTRVYAQMTPDNLDLLSWIPFHPDFTTPPNWPGGKGEVIKRYDEVFEAYSFYPELHKKMNIVR